jgi:uncharacterized protein YneR
MTQFSIGQAINGLRFDSSVFIEMNLSKGQDVNDFTRVDKVITIKKGTTLCITSANAFYAPKRQEPEEDLLSIWINNQIIYYFKSKFVGEIWLPEGEYRIRLVSRIKSKGVYYMGYISGILYKIEN